MFKLLDIMILHADVHECDVDRDNCSTNAICINSIGSYICQCQSGYTGSGVTCNGTKISYFLTLKNVNVSSDINECAIGTDNCDTHAVCTNTVGSFTCTCRSGYDGDGTTCSGKTNLKVCNK